MDVVTYALLSGKVSGVESMVTSLAEGFDYKGSVSSVDNLPDDAAAGDLYTVDGKKYVWDGTSWVELKDSIELDTTLATSGKAADAKATGDAIAEVAEDVSDLEDTVTAQSEAIGDIETFLSVEESVVGSRNKFNLAAATDGLLQSDGSIEAATNRITSDFIPVTSGTDYRNCYWNGSGCTNLAVRYSLYYDANKQVIGAGPTTSTGTFEAENLAYIRYSTNAGDSTYCMLLLGETSTADIKAFIPYAQGSGKTFGKKYKVVANGDSITFGHKPSADGYDDMTNGVSYLTMACTELGFELENDSISMSTLTVNTDGTDTHDALVNRYSSMSNDADLVYIAIGSNDWYYDNAELGTMDDRVNNTFYGAMHLLCAGLKQKYGAIPIVFATPIKRWIIREDSEIPGNLNSHSEPITGICTAIKEVCEYYGIPVVDMYAESFINPWESYDRTNYAPDGTHPNGAGHSRMEITCLAMLRKYLPIIEKRMTFTE